MNEYVSRYTSTRISKFTENDDKNFNDSQFVDFFV